MRVKSDRGPRKLADIKKAVKEKHDKGMFSILEHANWLTGYGDKQYDKKSKKVG